MFPVDSRVGGVVGVETWNGITHFSIWTGSIRDGEPTVVTSGPLTGIVEQKLSEFSEGQEVTWRGFPSQRSGAEVVESARSEIGGLWLPWDNCEHLVRRVHGVPEESPQLQAALQGAAAACVVVAAVAAVKKA